MEQLTADKNITLLGPIAPLLGIWEGAQGQDTAPSDDRGTEQNRFREVITFELLSPVTNHEQQLFGLRYFMQAWQEGVASPFHEETGYWLWDPREQHVMRCTLIPRGVSLMAGGKVLPDAKSFELSAECGSPTYGICSNPFLDTEFKTVRFSMKLKFPDNDTMAYEQTTFLKMKNRVELFQHTDRNELKRVGRKTQP
jgi:hypothetical protein